MPTINNFTSYFDINNWTLTPDTGNIDTTNAPISIELVSSNTGGGEHNTTVTIPIPSNGIINFNWNSSTEDGWYVFDPFGYLLNGIFYKLTKDYEQLPESGIFSLLLNIGDVFGFCEKSTDSVQGSSTTIISNFSFVYVDAPTSVFAEQSLTSTSVTLTWTAPIDNGGSSVTNYVIYNNGSLFDTTTDSSTSYIATNLTLGQTYNFTVAAQNALGIGLQSSPSVSVTILAPPPTPPIPVPCFNHDTKILCLNKFSKEEYVPIQDLRKGDLVKTYLHGYKRIDMIGMDTMINNPDNWQECMFKMEKTEENALTEDLIVTGWHSVLVKNLTPEQEEKHKELDFIYHIDNKCLLLASVSEDFQKLENRDEYTYYNLTLESSSETKRYGIYANGILVETPSKKQFLKHAYKELM